MKLFGPNKTENIINSAANRQLRLNKSHAITTCLINAGFSINFISSYPIKVYKILTCDCSVLPR